MSSLPRESSVLQRGMLPRECSLLGMPNYQCVPTIYGHQKSKPAWHHFKIKCATQATHNGLKQFIHFYSVLLPVKNRYTKFKPLFCKCNSGYNTPVLLRASVRHVLLQRKRKITIHQSHFVAERRSETQESNNTEYST